MSPWSVFPSKSKPQHLSQPPTNFNNALNITREPDCSDMRLLFSAAEVTISNGNVQTATNVSILKAILL
jgi:hypothetical protein